jgi:hypothetical protein
MSLVASKYLIISENILRYEEHVTFASFIPEALGEMEYLTEKAL